MMEKGRKWVFFVAMLLFMSACSINVDGTKNDSGKQGGSLEVKAVVQTKIVSATASTVLGGNTAAMSCDGNTGTRWESVQGADPQWIYWDLGSSQQLNMIIIDWEAASASNYTIQGSADAVAWTTLSTTLNAKSMVNHLMLTNNLSGTFRYVRMYGTTRTTGYGYSIWEVTIFTGSSSSAASVPVSSSSTPVVSSVSSSIGVTLATIVSATASTVLGGNTAAMSFDKNLGTRWESVQGADPQWIYWDLGSNKTLNKIMIDWEVAQAAAYQIQGSTDATAWTTLATVANTSQVDHNQITTALSGSYRYVRMYGTSRTTIWGYSIWEVSIYVGISASSSSAPVSSSGISSSSGPVSSSGDFWGDTSNIPAATQVLTIKFINRTYGAFSDDQVYWSFKSGTINEVHTIAEKSTYDMPANSSGRLYVGVAAAPDPANPHAYWDFIEFTIGPAQFNGNTTRVDGFGLKIAMRLHCKDGYDIGVGENEATFKESRAATFQRFIDAMPVEFKNCAQTNAPYQIKEPGGAGFNAGGPYATYYDSYINTMWANNGLTIAKPGPNGSGLGAYPDISAAIFRHVGAEAGTFNANGSLKNQSLWLSDTNFYKTAPAMYYAKFWHDNAISNKAYGFPYDDVGGYSSYISHANPQYLILAIGY